MFINRDCHFVALKKKKNLLSLTCTFSGNCRLKHPLCHYSVYILWCRRRKTVLFLKLIFLQIRGTLKSWTKLWCVLKPGVLLIYKTQKNGQWVGTVLLNACEIIERPSKKDGFCFKLFHPLEQSIWAVKVSEHLLYR